MMRILLLLSLVFGLLWAESLFEQGMRAYKARDYSLAFKRFTAAYNTSEDEDAAYMIAKMYDRGEGVKANRSMADLWYKRASELYFSTSADSLLHQENKRMLGAYRQLDPIENNVTAETIRKAIVSDFGLKAYRENYLLPFGYRQGQYDSYTPSDTYTNIETEMQLSFRLDFFPDLLGLNETYTLAYTQRSFWQLYAPSAPFRESNYQPEVFVTFPVYMYKMPLKALSVGFAHQSNGQGNITHQDLPDANLSDFEGLEPYLRNRSRSWNRVWTEAVFQTGSLFTELTLWYRIKDHGADDNPGLIDYMGHGSLRLILPYGKSVTKVMARQNFMTGKGCQQLTWSYPFASRESVFWYVKVFTGYGESLIDYDNYVTKFSVGFSFSR